METVAERQQSVQTKSGRKAPSSVALLVTINGVPYDVQPIPAGEFGSKAYRLSKQAGEGQVYDVIRTNEGIVECDCPHYSQRLQGNTLTPCKHGAALVHFGMLEAPAPELTRPDGSPLRKTGRGWKAPTDRPMPRSPELDRKRAAAFGTRPPAPAPVAGVTRPRDEFDEPTAPPITAELPAVAGGAPEPEPASCCAPTEPAPCSACVAPADNRPTVAEILADSFPPPEADDQAEEQAGRLTLAQAIQAQADAFKAHGTDFGNLLAEAIEALAMDVHFHGSATPAQYRRDLQLARDRDYEAFRKAEEQAEGGR